MILFEQYPVFLEHTSSTNDWMREQILNGQKLKNGYCVWTDSQSVGRGQAGNSWYTGSNENIACTIYITFNQYSAADFFGVSASIAIAVAKMLMEYGIEAKLKWPNDVFVGNSKIAGILIENFISGRYLDASIVGIGLNVNELIFPKMNNIAVSMSQLTNQKFDLKEVISCLLSKIEIEILNLQKKGLTKTIETYQNMLCNWLVTSEFITNNEKWTGIVQGISPMGELLVLNKESELKAYQFKEISLLEILR